MSYSGFRASIRCLLCFLTIALVECRVQASSVDEVVALISKNVLKYLEDQGKKELFVDQFKGPKTSGGRLLEAQIREKLKADGVTILADDLEASWTLRGQLSTDTTGKNAIVAVKVELLDGGGNSKAEFKKRFRDDPEVQAALEDSLPSGVDKTEADAVIDGTDNVSKLVPVTSDTKSKVEAVIGTKADAPALTTSVTAPKGQASVEQAVAARAIPAKVQKEALVSPSFFAEAGTRVRASDKSGFGIEIRASPTVDGQFVPVPVEDRGGRAFVNLPPEQFFQIHVFNNEKFDVGMELRMDGINTMHFQEGAPDSVREDGKWLIRAGSQGVAVKGWFINPGRVDRFIIKPEPDGVAASLGRPHTIGTIQASFFMARTVGQGPSAFASVFDQTKNSVGRGAPTEFNGRMEERVFESGQSLASIAILYRNPTPPDLPPAAAAQ
ncbi:MAG: hypothetical protein ACK526_21150 [Planctomyces sp.]